MGELLTQGYPTQSPAVEGLLCEGELLLSDYDDIQDVWGMYLHLISMALVAKDASSTKYGSRLADLNLSMSQLIWSS